MNNQFVMQIFCAETQQQHQRQQQQQLPKTTKTAKQQQQQPIVHTQYSDLGRLSTFCEKF